MSAKTEVFLEIKKVIDHDCGNYRIGEIDYYPEPQIKQYIQRHGEFGLRELQDCFHGLIEVAKQELIHKSNLEQVGSACAGQ